MRSAAILVAVLLASGCSAGDEAVETVTVTRTVTAPAPTTTNGAATTAPRLPTPLPPDGTLPVAEFNAYTASISSPSSRANGIAARVCSVSAPSASTGRP